MDLSLLKREFAVRYRIDIGAVPGMRVPGIIYIDKTLLEDIKTDRSLDQVAQAATLPGIVKASLAMPDIHQGYGLPIGGVVATDAKTGVVTPGGVGYDINCGVRVLKTALDYRELEGKTEALANQLLRDVPAGVGKKGEISVPVKEMDAVLELGAEWMVGQGYLPEEDLDFIEEHGRLKAADASHVSEHAKKRGMQQLATLGSGNHFVEVQVVEQIFDKTAAAAFGLATNQVILMIHSGSRGLGYQIAADYIRVAQDDSSARGERLADRQLAFLYNDSKLGQDYLGAMACGMNYAWANRSGLAYFVRKAWERIVNDEPLPMLYDISHNTAKLETHRVDGAERNLLVHRKGATRAFPPNHPAVPDVFKPVGQPVFIPGSMGTASYILIVTEHAMGETFGSVCHGAGRIMSRKQAVSQFQGKTLKESLKMKNILVRTYSMRGLAEEAPLAYKDVDNVVSVVERAGLAKRVARLRPIIVIKGD